ncbi:glutathionylspermidine synthase family protein [Flaviaesturariibacter flavus]|uniref:Glutathionylspermidine synthase family protein n=1 Tax=Flaviaesturariibacter flavus TaxID=2502780 RepID=A0A4R1BMH3_9BACT|nr:glutathionylspermidine synthase family protein [Flaviaesturariibacter flavus]TCJ18653.1 glutathionylspermidine synthase family protein [Flaviaesturariibacter flavus]
MQRHTTQPRHNWQAAVEGLGFGFHSTDVPYWDESAYYSLSMEEVLFIERATAELWTLCLDAVQHVIDEGRYAEFAIPEWIVPLIERSWTEDHPAIYGRFDLCYKDGQLKLLEFNADTPTSLYEAGIVQWFWLQDFAKDKDQFNSIHERLIAYWKYLKSYLHDGPLHFSCLKETLEDLTNTEYLRDCAMQAGLDTKLVFVDDIGWDQDSRQFVDMEDAPIRNIFKLYPWEWLLEEDFGRHIPEDSNRAYWIEPAWKMILSNKAILAVLWERNPGHPYLLPAYFEPNGMTDFVKKPILGREGANVHIVRGGELEQFVNGQYGKEGYVFQQLFELPEFNGRYPVIGSWVIGQEPAGMGIREADGLVTDNKSRFVPHLIDG